MFFLVLMFHYWLLKWNQTSYSTKGLLPAMLVPCYVSSKIKRWHFIRSIENVRAMPQFALGLAHQLQQMQNCMKRFHLMVTKNINISVQKALMPKCRVHRDRMELAECPFAEDRVLIPPYSCHRRFSCSLCHGLTPAGN